MLAKKGESGDSLRQENDVATLGNWFPIFQRNVMVRCLKPDYHSLAASYSRSRECSATCQKQELARSTLHTWR